ncbi:hypothetical protein ABT404_06370 [Streptomyces hyaluromycini]|uniref:Uncharacterized protein n=1 Tax=Streptomyces hyaluromycini TaxID=1377993 RepID=A0ABV1WQH1_9ACTN
MRSRDGVAGAWSPGPSEPPEILDLYEFSPSRRVRRGVEDRHRSACRPNACSVPARWGAKPHDREREFAGFHEELLAL